MAAAIWAIRASRYLEVTAPSERRRPGICVHRSRLPPDEKTEVRRIPVTTVPRTLLDLAAVVPSDQLERAVNEAEIQGLRDVLSLPDLLARYPGRRGVLTLKEIQTRLKAGARYTRSGLEDRFLLFIRRKRLPLPRVNPNLHGYECDCVWPEHRLIVELDGRAAHDTAVAFDRDRARDRALAAHGWRVVRVTWRQPHQSPEALAADLRRMLGLRAPPPAPARAGGP